MKKFFLVLTLAVIVASNCAVQNFSVENEAVKKFLNDSTEYAI